MDRGPDKLGEMERLLGELDDPARNELSRDMLPVGELDPIRKDELQEEICRSESKRDKVGSLFGESGRGKLVRGLFDTSELDPDKLEHNVLESGRLD